MNTPEPCDKCDYLYADCMQHDNPNHSAECKLGLELGNRNCKKYKNSEEIKFDKNGIILL